MFRAQIAVLSLLFLTAQAPRPAPWAPTLQRLETPAAPGSSAPQLSGSSRGPILSWLEREGTSAALKFSERRGGRWSAPRTVASGGDWFVNWADVPSVVRLASGELAAHWLQKSGAGTYAYDVRLSHSADDGLTWSPPVTPHSDGTKTEHGFASLFQAPGGGLGLVWLDGRAMTPSTHGHGGGDGAMSLRFASFSTDWKQTAETAVDTRVCECCPTTAALTADGPIVAYRNRSDTEVRDIYVSRLERGRWTEPRAAVEDGWTVAACPVNGPALSARGRDVVLAWFTARDDRPRAFAAFSRDAGRTFGAPIRLDGGATLGRVDVEMLPDGSAMASWIEFAGGRSELRARRVHPSGAVSPPVAVAGLAGGRASGYPRLALDGEEIVFAWTEGEGERSQVRTASAPAPRDR